MARNRREPIKRRIVEMAPEALTNDNTSKSGRLGTRRSVNITRSTIIRAPVEECFHRVMKQLEETPQWDPMIREVQPLVIRHVRVGSMSRVIFSLNGSSEEAVVLVRAFVPNRSLFWTSTHSSQLQEEWQFRPLPFGTMVLVTLGYNPSGGLAQRISGMIAMRRKFEKSVDEMLNHLQVFLESAKDP